MFERISQLAERSATNASRRQFLGQAATWAGGLAAVLAGLLMPRVAHASSGQLACIYSCVDGGLRSRKVSCSKECPPVIGSKQNACYLISVNSSGC